MNQKTLSKLLKLAIILIGLIALFGYCVLIPLEGKELIDQYPEFSGWFWPWLIFLCLSAVPFFAVLAIGWIIAGDVGRDRAFTDKNAARFKWIAWLAGGAAAYIFIGNAVLLFLNMNHPGVMLMLLLVSFLCVVAALAAGVVSCHVKKAAALQQQSELTI